jgi:hypothetical protein
LINSPHGRQRLRRGYHLRGRISLNPAGRSP